ncbi:alpha/beta fold hydrolase [Ureibacillus manganicus]|uniref:alpha/beta fold hydrolase n=1 Tax=Ureibacillus manganicus TaxID=1266064 RepID=UPI00068FD03A|nr:alpha/beta hydrolase [Ureibacillus manganicus]
MLIGFFVLIGILLLGLCYEQISRRNDARRPLPGQLLDVGGYPLHITERGESGSTIVLIHGAGDSSYSWIHIQRELSKYARVITYDRAGMGSSGNGPIPIPKNTVNELNTLLQNSGAQGPYIIVGHSLGGLIARLYALKYPKQVAGLVFLDSTHEFLKDDTKFKQGFGFIGFMLKILRVLSPFGIPRFFGNVFNLLPMYGNEQKYYKSQIHPEEYKQWKGIVYRILAGKTAGLEFKGAWAHLDEAAKQLNNSSVKPQFGDLPIAVLNNPGFGEQWTEMQKELATRSTNHIHMTSDRKGHSLQMPRPEYVIDVVQHVMKQVQKRNSRTLADSYYSSSKV